MAVKDILNMNTNEHDGNSSSSSDEKKMMKGGVKQEMEEKKVKRFPWTWDDV